MIKFALLYLLLLTARTAATPTLDQVALGESFGGWNDKDGAAARFTSDGSWYRVYRPTVSTSPDGGPFISFKADHDRNNLPDDHCHVEMTFDRDGVLVSSRAILDLDNQQIDSSLIVAATATTTKNARASAIAFVAAEVFNRIKAAVDSITDHGGRRNFPAVVRHSMNRVAAAVRNPVQD